MSPSIYLRGFFVKCLLLICYCSRSQSPLWELSNESPLWELSKVTNQGIGNQLWSHFWELSNGLPIRELVTSYKIGDKETRLLKMS